MIVIAIGANLPSAKGPPLATCRDALADFSKNQIEIVRASAWYETPAWPPSDQPHYVNGIVVVTTRLAPLPLMNTLHAIEAAHGRTRGNKNQARTLDLDLIAYDAIVQSGPPQIPHPRMAERVFVLAPLCDVAPHWIHPVSGMAAAEMLAKIQQNQVCRRIAPPG